MIIRRFEEGDLQKVDLQNEQRHEVEGVEYPADMSFTLEEGGVILGCFALLEVTKKRAVICSFISKDAGKAMYKMVKKLRALLDDGIAKTRMDRVEMTVLSGFKHGERFAEMLGFECEGVMRKYYKGKDYKLYARVK